MTTSNPFALLGTAPKYDLDLEALEKTYREIARALHPDKFMSAPPSERRTALSRAVEVNEAWRTLRDPVKRAEALFLIRGVRTGDGHEPKASPLFLMEMMEAREALGEAREANDTARIRVLAKEAEAKLDDCYKRLSLAFGESETARLKESAALLGEIRFHRRFLEEAEAVLFDASDTP